MNKLNEIKQTLDKNNIAYKLHKVPPGTGTSVDEHIKAFGLDYSDGCATIIYKTGTGFIALLRRDDTKVKNRQLKKAAGVKDITFATPEQLESVTGFKPGMVSPITLEIPVFIDEKVLEKKTVRVGTGGNEFSLEINPIDIISLLNAKVVKVSATKNESVLTESKTKRILTGDRPTGKLHIGHLKGSLENRAKLQDEYETFILIANIHALSDNRDNPEKVRYSIEELLCDYYATGINFEKTTVYIQSEVPEVHEIFMYLSNFTSVQNLMHNPTLKTEIDQNNMNISTPLGFFVYPIHQAADILCVNADLVPVGKDQAPMIEDTREIARRFNNQYKKNVLNEPQGLFGVEKNVPGTDGNAKMGKSLGNFISLSETEQDLKKKVFSVYTDPNRIHATDPGTIEGNVAFAYHDLFNTDKEEIANLKDRYKKGKVGDVEVKEKLFNAMNAVLTPIRERRKEAEEKKKELLSKALEGSVKVSKIARGIADKMKDAMKIQF